MPINYAQFVQKESFLNSAFGLELAMKKFNMTEDQLRTLCGVNSKGKRKGQIKGKILWYKVERGGWVAMGAYDHDARQGNGFVALPGYCFGFQLVDSWNYEPILMHPETCVDRYSGQIDLPSSYRWMMLKKEARNHDNTRGV